MPITVHFCNELSQHWIHLYTPYLSKFITDKDEIEFKCWHHDTTIINLHLGVVYFFPKLQYIIQVFNFCISICSKWLVLKCSQKISVHYSMAFIVLLFDVGFTVLIIYRFDVSDQVLNLLCLDWFNFKRHLYHGILEIVPKTLRNLTIIISPNFYRVNRFTCLKTSTLILQLRYNQFPPSRLSFF